MVCMKPLGDGLLAVSTRPGSTTLGNSFAGEYTAIDVPHAEAVHVIDLHNSALVSVLKGHRDTVMSMCVLPGGGLALRMDSPLPMEGDLRRDPSNHSAVRGWVQKMEAVIKERPMEWLNVHPLWRDKEDPTGPVVESAA